MPIDISVVVPVYNEAESISLLLAEIQQRLSATNIHYEVVVVDDGSQDETISVVEKFCAQDPRVQLYRHGSNRGQSASLRTGIRVANHQWIVTLDGDGQNDPKDIEMFVSLVAELSTGMQPILVAGHRMNRQDNWMKRLSSRVANGVRRFILQDDCLDTGCGLKMFRKGDILQLPLFDHFHRFLPALMRAAGGQVINVPVNHRPRMRGQSKYGVLNRLWVGIVDMIGVMWLCRRNKCWLLKP